MRQIQPFKALPVWNVFRAQSEELISLLFVQAPNLSGPEDFFWKKSLITSVAPSENPQRCLQLAQGNPGFFFRFSCNWFKVWQRAMKLAFKRPQVTKWRKDIPKLVSSLKKLKTTWTNFSFHQNVKNAKAYRKNPRSPSVLCFLLPNAWINSGQKGFSLHLCSTQTCLNLSNCFPSHAKNA